MAFDGWHSKVSTAWSNRAHTIPHPCGLPGCRLSVVWYSRRGFSRGGHGWDAVGDKCILVLHALTGQDTRCPRIARMHGTRQSQACQPACRVKVASEKLDRGRPTGRSRGHLSPLSPAGSFERDLSGRHARSFQKQVWVAFYGTQLRATSTCRLGQPTPANAAPHRGLLGRDMLVSHVHASSLLRSL